VEILAFAAVGSLAAIDARKRASSRVARVKSSEDASVPVASPKNVTGRPVSRYLHAVFYVLFGFGVLLTANSRYVRPLEFYVCVTAAYLVTFVQILKSSRGSSATRGLILVELILCGGLLRLGYYFLNPTSVVSDTFLHWLAIRGIAQTGHLSPDIGYAFYFPAYHLLHAIGMQVAGLSFSNYQIFGHLVMLIAIPAAYLFGRIWDEEIGLIAAFLISMTPFLLLTVILVPSVLGMPMIILAMYCIWKARLTGRAQWRAAFWIATLFVLFSHPVTALVYGSFLAVFSMQRVTSGTQKQLSSDANTTLSYVVGYVAYLSLIAISTFTLFVVSLLSSGYQPPLATSVSPAILGPIFVVQTGFSLAGFAALYLFAGYLSLKWLIGSHAGERLVSISWLILNALPLVEILRGNFSLQSSRVLLYLSFPLALFGAAGLSTILKGGKGRLLTRASVLLGVAVLIFASSTSYLTADGNRVVSSAVPSVAWYLADGTLEAGSFLNHAPASGDVYLDYTSFSYIGSNESGRIPYSLVQGRVIPLSGDVIGQPGLYLFNQQYFGYQTYSANGAQLLSPDLESRIALEASSRVYDSGLCNVFHEV
jgi:hypothetical protein